MKLTAECPHCHMKQQFIGVEGETKEITCSNCGKKAILTFPSPCFHLKDGCSIIVAHLTKLYNSMKAVDDISFQVKAGEILGFLGPNGAGKTTTIKALLGLIHVDNGTILLNNMDINKQSKLAKKYIGYLPEKVAFYNNLTALQNLEFYAEMKKTSKKECHMLIDEFGLKEATFKKVGAFSKGMIQRLGVARAFLGNPQILILDEPTEGLDARGVVLIRQKILDAKKQGKTVFVSSHILSEIQAVCDRVCIINKGRIVAEDTVAGLSKKLNIQPILTIELESITEKMVDSVKHISGVEVQQITDKTIVVSCSSELKLKVLDTISKAKGNILNFQIKEPSLEDVFMRFTEDA